MSEKPPIEYDSNTVSETLLDELIANIATLASVYHKSPALLGHEGTVDLKKEEYVGITLFMV